MSPVSILCLGAGDGWHSRELRLAATNQQCRICFATYESLASKVSDHGLSVTCDAGSIGDFDVILTRTMPAGSLEQITFRLAILHQLQAEQRIAIVNPPRALEIAIDKFATLALVSALGYPVPETIVVQSRSAALDAFRALGGDCVVKPVFGGEGRGVMRIKDAELAWYAFSALEQLGAAIYVQRFIPPGGRDTRLLVIGQSVLAIRRRNDVDFRTNAASGAQPQAVSASAAQIAMARNICNSIGLKIAAVDVIDSDDGGCKVLEVNAIPGWKGAQSVLDQNVAELMIGQLQSVVLSKGLADVKLA
jgi:ribosomal protein S6--L-glutamate ligase